MWSMNGNYQSGVTGVTCLKPPVSAEDLPEQPVVGIWQTRGADGFRGVSVKCRFSSGATRWQNATAGVVTLDRDADPEDYWC